MYNLRLLYIAIIIIFVFINNNVKKYIILFPFVLYAGKYYSLMYK